MSTCVSQEIKLFSQIVSYYLYIPRSNLIAIEMVYNGYFGKGNNVIHRWLADNGLFLQYPYGIRYSKEDFITILGKGKVDVSNVIID